LEVLVRVKRPEGPPCVPKMSLDCTKLFLGTFQAPEEPYCVLEIFLSFRKLGPVGPHVVPKMSAVGLWRALRGPRKGPVQNKKK